MKRKLFILLLPIMGLWSEKSYAQCDCGNGADGAFHATNNETLVSGTYNYTTFTIDAGMTVNVTGNDPLIIKCTGKVLIDGILTVSGGDGGSGVTSSNAGLGGIGVAGGYNGADGVYDGSISGSFIGVAGSGPGAGNAGDIWGGGSGGGHGVAGMSGAPYGSGPIALGGTTYGDVILVNYDGGSGGGSGSGGNFCGSGGGGAGGGILILQSCDTIVVTGGGVIYANGGNGGWDGGGDCGSGGGGAGGTIWLISDILMHDGSILATGGLGGFSANSPDGDGGMGGAGRIRLDYNAMYGSGNTAPNAGYTTQLLQDIMTEIHPTCNGDIDGSASAAPFGGGGSYTYSWDNGPITAANNGLGGGTYIVTITDANGCIINDTAVIVEPAALSSVGSSTNETTVSANDGTVTVTVSGGTAPYTYSWSPGGGTTNPLTGLDTGNYIVTITDDKGCTMTDTVHVGQGPVSISTTIAESEIVIYPNPANDVVIIDSKNVVNGKVSIQLMDALGRVLTTDTYSNTSEFRVRVDQYPVGSYMLKINMNGNVRNVPLSISR